MRFEIIILLIAGFIIANIYTEGKVLKTALSWKKYYQMAGVALGAIMIYWLIKKNPANAKNIIMSSNEYIKYLPVDKNASSILSPILDFTAKHAYTQDQYSGGYNNPIMAMPVMKEDPYVQRISNSGKKSTKRSVSETKKKFVAARQGWKCEKCTKQLPAWFEVDHVIRLEHGGSNHIDNLVALCRDCHGEKTAIENL